MNLPNKQLQSLESKRGFTIIEVVLVLAIAALIFLMVFIALPSLQRGQRDTQRKDDLARVQTQLQNFTGNAKGKIPTDATGLGTFVQKYLGGSSATCAGEEYKDPNKTMTSCDNYTVTFQDMSAGTLDPAEGQVKYTYQAKCKDDGTGGVAAASGRSYAITVLLENQNSLPYCLDNQ